MQEKDIQVVTFADGELKFLRPELKAKEAVLALPLTRMILRMVRVEKGADPVEAATPILKEMNPFPEDELAVSCEKVFENETEELYIAAALPESAAEDVAEALDAAKINVVKIDSLAIGELRGAWDKIAAEDGARRLIKIKSSGSTAMIILDGDHPVALRSVLDDSEMKREEILLRLEAEDFGGAKELKETIELEASDAALEGVYARAMEERTLDVLPDSWREVLAETRYKAKLIRNVAIAAGIWALVMAVLFGVPVGYGFMTDYQKGLSREHAKAYKQVKEKKEKTELVQKYSDHARGALEIMRAVSDRLPDGITLSSWDYTRGEAEDDYAKGGVHFRGESDDRKSITGFKDAMADLTAVDEEDDNSVPEIVFKTVNLGQINDRKGKQSFDLELRYKEAEDE